MVSSLAHIIPGLTSWLFPVNYSRPEDFRVETSPFYEATLAYGRSKLANVLFSHALSRRLKSSGVRVNSCHPGAVSTNLYHGLLEAGWGYPVTLTDLVGHGAMLYVKGWIDRFIYMGSEHGAVTQLFLATSPRVENEDITGQYFTPQAQPKRA